MPAMSGNSFPMPTWRMASHAFYLFSVVAIYISFWITLICDRTRKQNAYQAHFFSFFAHFHALCFFFYSIIVLCCVAYSHSCYIPDTSTIKTETFAAKEQKSGSKQVIELLFLFLYRSVFHSLCFFLSREIQMQIVTLSCIPHQLTPLCKKKNRRYSKI